ncbi:MAG: aminopeptidase [Candidatus Latescibacterota bacterium]|nr:aminopeptidase [Candidatus Latescibacterota bacterium]
MSQSPNRLQAYGELALGIGLNLQPGQRLMISAPIETAPLVRAIAASAYQLGAPLVDVSWSDDTLTRTRFENAPRDSFKEFPEWRTRGMLECAKRGDAFLSIVATDPELLNDQDPELITLAQRTRLKHSQEYIDYLSRMDVNWCVISVPIPSWAHKMFPDLHTDTAIARLWDAIATVCRLGEPDPVRAWECHLEALQTRCDQLNEQRWSALRFTGPGTDLTVGLADEHTWVGGQSQTPAGIWFTPNVPTEEVFTMPHRERVEGTVSSSVPLNYAGQLIENFSLAFRTGKVVEMKARTGEEVLRGLVDTDKGAGRLGEVALVPDSSPISQLGLLFYNTLFDENAASHVALGRAYPGCVQSGEQMSEEDLAKHGANVSLTHVDFMIGSNQMDVAGVAADGSSQALMAQGEWVD